MQCRQCGGNGPDWVRVAAHRAAAASPASGPPHKGAGAAKAAVPGASANAKHVAEVARLNKEIASLNAKLGKVGGEAPKDGKADADGEAPKEVELDAKEELDRRIAYQEDMLKAAEQHKMGDEVARCKAVLRKLREERAALLPGPKQLGRVEQRLERATEALKKAEEKVQTLKEQKAKAIAKFDEELAEAEEAVVKKAAILEERKAERATVAVGIAGKPPACDDQYDTFAKLLEVVATLAPMEGEFKKAYDEAEGSLKRLGGDPNGDEELSKDEEAASTEVPQDAAAASAVPPPPPEDGQMDVDAESLLDRWKDEVARQMARHSAEGAERAAMLDDIAGRAKRFRKQGGAASAAAAPPADVAPAAAGSTGGQ